MLLLKDLPGTGRRGDVKDVADGYARNFLFRQKLAKVATEGTLEHLKQELSRQKRESEADLKQNQKVASQLDGKEIHLAEKASPEGRLYAAIGGRKITDAIKSQLGAVVTSKQIETTASIKECGEHKARVIFPHGLEAELTVVVSES